MISKYTWLTKNSPWIAGTRGLHFMDFFNYF